MAIFDKETAIAAPANYVELSGYVPDANGRASIDPDADGEGFGVNVDGTVRVLIEANEAAENGPAAERVRRGILVEDSVNVTGEGNLIDHNELDAGGDYWDGAIWVDGGHNVTLRGNTITDNHGPGIQISDEDVQYPDASFGYVVEENLMTGNRFGIYLWNLGECPFPRSEMVRFSDNTIQGSIERDVWCLGWPCGLRRSCD